MDKRREILLKNLVYLNENRIIMNKNELRMMDRFERIGVSGIESENLFNVVAELAIVIKKKTNENRLNIEVLNPVAVCKLCGKNVRWIKTKAGKTACIDAEPYKGEEFYSPITHNYHFTACKGK